MKYVLLFGALAALYLTVESKTSPPKVQVYSRGPGEYGKENILICRVTGFHPPNIKIQLMKNDEELPNSVQTDLAFESDWHFHLTKHAPFTPQSGEKYVCRVTHGNAAPKDYSWEPNM
ncbi:beta-2-microglobulin-like [Sphaeramia orbicularis]|uniref:Beta-2-microglobulin n=1 Tax=Sphaeramia orbicularis TaxID=375764 RepID=A0A672YWX8_9TELE|nr:beta-2-microglobulin-like [Sphaeramia orbicularis]